MGTKKTTQKKVPRGLKVNLLPDAIVDKEFLGQPGTRLVVSRFRDGKETYSFCVVKDVSGEGFINTFDETLQQWFAFTIQDRPSLVKIYAKD